MALYSCLLVAVTSLGPPSGLCLPPGACDLGTNSAECTVEQIPKGGKWTVAKEATVPNYILGRLSIISKVCLWGWASVAQLVQCLASVHKDLSQSPSSRHIGHGCTHLSSWYLEEQGTATKQVQAQPGLHEPLFQNKQQKCVPFFLLSD